jgi:hypothetical protein
MIPKANTLKASIAAIAIQASLMTSPIPVPAQSASPKPMLYVAPSQIPSVSHLTEVRVNGEVLSVSQLAEIERIYRVRPKPGDYWYDAVSGLYGLIGRPAYGFMFPGHKLGNLAEDASAGNTGVFVNRRRIPLSEWLVWSNVLGAAVLPGRYWMDGRGNVGYEGVPIAVLNLYVVAAQNAQRRMGWAGGGSGGGGDNFWSSRFSAGNHNADNSQGYVSVPGYGPVGYGF